jgi:pimeloyl-ACP methyl ester carboxylesterase
MPTLRVPGAELYHEVRGAGPPVLMIPGALGDGGTFDRVAPLLADEFTVVTYDRRGNSRSPRPSGWTETSVAEQADDAAALLEALGLAPAVLYGTSGGGAIALEVVLRHPGVVRGVILHDPWVPALSGRAAAGEGPFGPEIERGWAADGPGGAVDAFLRAVLGEQHGPLDPDRPSRIRGNGEVAFRVESPAWAAFAPDPERLAAARPPIAVMCGRDSAPLLREPAAALAARLGTEPIPAPGAHAPQLDRPQELAEAIRPLLRRLAAV